MRPRDSPPRSRRGARIVGTVSRNDGLDPLYEAPPREFVTARNALAARLKQAGDEAGARRVREIPRPKAAVWAINRVARRSPKLVRAVVDAFDALKKAQLRNPAATPSGVDALKGALDAVTRAAMTALSEAGMKPSLDTRRRIDGTLRGAAASTRGALLAGSLTDELAAPGFDVFSGAVPTGKPRLRVVTPLHAQSAPPRDGARRSSTPDEAAERRAARNAMLERRAGQLEEEARTTEREAEAAAAAAHEARRRLREMEANARATASRASKHRALAHKARARVSQPKSGGRKRETRLADTPLVPADDVSRRGDGGAPRSRPPRTRRASPAPRKTRGRG